MANNDKNRIGVPIWFVTIVVAAMFAMVTDLCKRVRSIEVDVAKITTAMEITTDHDVCQAESSNLPHLSAIAGSQFNQTDQTPQNASEN